MKAVHSWPLLKSMRRRNQHFQNPNGGGTPGFNAEFFKYFLHVLFDGGLGDAENSRDVWVGLALSEPKQRFGGARREAEFQQRLGRGEIGFEFAICLLFGAAEPRFDCPDEVLVGHGLG